MCNVSGIIFGATALKPADVAGKRVLEVGALDVNGSLRSILAGWGPASYLGVDVSPGPGVDEVCPCEQLTARFGENAFDLVVSTEMLEHVGDWRLAIRQLKAVCAPGGLILLTTRSPGFPYHGYPYDFWRFDCNDMQAIFADCESLDVRPDPQDAGVFVLAKKPIDFSDTTPERPIHSIVTGKPQHSHTPADFKSAHFRRLRFKMGLKDFVLRLGKSVLAKI